MCIEWWMNNFFRQYSGFELCTFLWYVFRVFHSYMYILLYCLSKYWSCRLLYVKLNGKCWLGVEYYIVYQQLWSTKYICTPT